MSPEQVESAEITPASDIYSLGAVMYELLTGFRPFRASSLSRLLSQIVYATPPPLHTLREGVPDELEQVVMAVLVKDPATRLTAAEFAARLGDYIDIPEFARFMAVMVFLSDMDGLFGSGQNFYLHLHPKTQILTFIPWDQDHSFGQFAMRGTQEQRESLSMQKPWERRLVSGQGG